MSTNYKSFEKLAGIPVWYHLRDEPNPGDEKIDRTTRTYQCSQRLLNSLNECFGELFAIWPMDSPKAILSMGTLGDGGNEHGKGNAFDLSGFVLQDGSILRVFDYPDWIALHDGINAHLFLYFSQVLNHFYPNHRDHFHLDYKYANKNYYRTNSRAQTFFIQSILHNTFNRDLGTSGRYDNGIDGIYGGLTRKALDEVIHNLGLAGSGGLGNHETWQDFLLLVRDVSFSLHRSQANDPGGDSGNTSFSSHIVTRPYSAVRKKFYNRKKPPVQFLDTLIKWARDADDEIFIRNEGYDVYSRTVRELGPWQGLPHRKAAMCETLRVLGGFESSWNWEEGRDLSANNTEHDTTEGGIFQCSANSLYFFRNDPYLETIFQKLGISTPGKERSRQFLKISKTDYSFALEYTARLLRHTINHHGPIKNYYGRWYQGRRHDGIGQHLSRSAMNEFLIYLD